LAQDIKSLFMFVTLHTFAMVSVALLICASFATPVSARDEVEAMGLMHTNTKVDMAVASSGEIHVVADDEMELMSNKQLVLQNQYIELMEASVQFKNKAGGRCLSSNVNSDSQLLFEDCDDSVTAQLWKKDGSGTYVSVAKSLLSSEDEFCPHVGSYVNCGRNSTILGKCNNGAGFKAMEDYYWGEVDGKKTYVGLKTFGKHCLAIFVDSKGVVDEDDKDLVVTLPGTDQYCGARKWGAFWLKIPLASTSSALADAAATAAALKLKADAAAKKAAEEQAAAEQAAAEQAAAEQAAAEQAAAEKAARDEAAKNKLYKLMQPGARCLDGTAIITETECRAAKEELGTLNFGGVESSEEKAPGCYQNKGGSKVFFNSNLIGQEDAGVPSVCHVAAVK